MGVVQSAIWVGDRLCVALPVQEILPRRADKQITIAIAIVIVIVIVIAIAIVMRRRKILNRWQIYFYADDDQDEMQIRISRLTRQVKLGTSLSKLVAKEKRLLEGISVNLHALQIYIALMVHWSLISTSAPKGLNCTDGLDSQWSISDRADQLPLLKLLCC